MRSDSQGPVVRLFMEEQIDFEPRATGSVTPPTAGGAIGPDDVGLAPSNGDDVLSIEELATRFNVSTKTIRSEEHTSELQSQLLISYAVFCV